MANRIKGITIEIDGNTTKLDKALQGVNKEIKTTQANLKDVDKLLKLDPTNTELLAQKQRLLRDAVDQTAEKLRTLKKAEEQMQEAVKSGAASQEQYDALQREIVATESALKDATKAADNFHPALEKVSGYASKAADALGTAADKTKALSTAGAAVVGVLAGTALKAAQTADELNTLSAVTGLSTETLQEMQYASSLVDVDVSTLTGSLKKLTKSMSSAKSGTGAQAEAFKTLGVKVTDTNGNLRDNEEVFYDLLEALSLVENETERDALSMEVFGKSASELNPIIQDGGKQLKELGKQAKDSGLIMSQETLDGANKLQDSIDKLKGTVSATVTKVGADVVQVLEPVVERVGEVIAEVLTWVRDLGADRILGILKIAAIVAAVSPVLSLLSKIASGMSLIMAHPLIAGAAALVGVLVGVGTAIANAQKPVSLLSEEHQALGQHVQETNEALQKSAEEIETATQAIVDRSTRIGEQYSTYEDLADKLIAITDEQGKVLAGHEKEVEYITGELAKALGITITYTDGQIEGYQDLQREIYNTIDARRAEALLAANIESYEAAKKRQIELSERLTDAEQNYNKVTIGLNDTIAKRQQKEAELQALIDDSTQEGAEYIQKCQELKLEIEKLEAEEAAYGAQLQAATGGLREAQEQYQSNMSTIENYERMEDALRNGTANLEESILAFSHNMRTASNADKATLEKQLKEYQDTYASMQRAVEEHGAKINQSQFDELQKLITITEQEIAKVGTTFVHAADNWLDYGEDMGRSVGDGTVKGINASLDKVSYAARSLGRAAASAAKQELAIASPSKVFEKIGAYTDEGLAEGIMKNLRVVDEAATTMAATVVGADISTSVGAQTMAAGVGAQPVTIALTQPIYLGGRTIGNAITEQVVANITSEQALQAAYVGV